MEDGKVVEVAISIADVSAFVHPGTPEDLEAARRGQTLYAGGSVVCPMLHPLLSEGAASLKADGIARPVLSLHLPSKTWKRQFLINQRTYTYETAPAELKEVFALCGAKSDDPHEWVERAMILYNVEAAKRIRGYGILRTQAAPEATKAAMWAAAAEASGEPSLTVLGYSAGVYAREGAHWALHEEAYCHATSPLRRYADLLNQRILIALLEGTPPPPLSTDGIDTLNERGQLAKHLDRSLLSIPPDTIVEGGGIVIDIRELKVGVYFLPWRSRITIRVVEPYPGAIGDRCKIKGFCDNTCTNLKRRMIWKLYTIEPE
jgi:exoribonuclease II